MFAVLPAPRSKRSFRKPPNFRGWEHDLIGSQLESPHSMNWKFKKVKCFLANKFKKIVPIAKAAEFRLFIFYSYITFWLLPPDTTIRFSPFLSIRCKKYHSKPDSPQITPPENTKSKITFADVKKSVFYPDKMWYNLGYENEKLCFCISACNMRDDTCPGVRLYGGGMWLLW